MRYSNCTIHKTTNKYMNVLLLCQVDNYILDCYNKEIAKEIFDITETKIQLGNENKSSFAYLGLNTDFNSVDIEQNKNHITISYANYIN